jgi:ribonuclease VapC
MYHKFWLVKTLGLRLFKSGVRPQRRRNAHPLCLTPELSMVVESQLGPNGMRQADAFLRRAGVVVEPVTIEQGDFARQAFLDFGKGRHKAGLNFGDCFAYVLARATGEALLFKGDDFALTDIRRA